MGRITIFLSFLSLGTSHLSYGFVSERVARTSLKGTATLVKSHLQQDDDNVANIDDNDDTSSRHSSLMGRQPSRRDYIASSIMTTAAALTVNPSGASAEYKPAVRPTAYRVDSTIPPSLLPIKDSMKNQILSGLGKGSGTDKEAVFIDRLNLNNMLNKAVFGTIDTVSGLANPKVSNSGPGYASFVCMGLPSETTSTDIDLALQLLDPIMKQRKSLPTAIGLSSLPYGAQSSLDGYSKGEMSLTDLENNLLEKPGVDSGTIELCRPVLAWATQNNVDVLALAPERDDAETARTQGLQFVDPDRRSSYVVDPDGFIALTQDARFKMYTDRSLLKDFAPRNEKETAGNFYAERILVHEAGATAAAKYAYSRPDSLVIVMAPVQDVRFLNGINGRIPRVFAKLRPNDSKVTDKAITTILLNPTARDTLSKSNYLRLEIGTSPEVLEYQTKVADYLWFSSSPKVNQIPRLMNG